MELQSERAGTVERFAAALRGAHAGIWEWSTVTDRISWSPEMAELAGMPSDVEPTREGFFERVHADDRAKLYLATVHAVDVSSEMSVELRILRPDGVRWIALTARVERENGKAVGMIGLAQDITPKREAEARYEHLANEVPCIVWTADPEGKDRFVSSRWREVTGHEYDPESSDPWEKITHPGDFAKMRSRWKRSISASIPYEAEVRYRMAAGNYRWYFERAVPRFDEDGRVAEWFGTSMDIHDQKTKEASLAFLISVNEATRREVEPDAVISTTLRLLGEHLEVSRCVYSDVQTGGETTRVRQEWSPNQPSLRGIYQRAEFGERVLSELRAGRSFVARDVATELPPDEGGDTFTKLGIAAIIACPVIKEGRQVSTLVVSCETARDWTADEVNLAEMVADRAWSNVERAKSERALRDLNLDLERRVAERTRELTEANREMEGFTYTVSHDLRAPLRAITATSMMLLQDSGSKLDPDEVTLLERQAHNAKRLGVLIDDLLKLSRLSREEMRWSEFDISDLAQEVIDELVADGVAGHIQFKITPNMTAYGDPRLIRFVLLNLFGNACKFSPPRKDSDCPVRFDRQDNAFFVSDNGIGFDPRYADRLFRPFERLVNESEFPGTGIGLANVKRIIERHAGSVWADSQPGQGATFWFTLGKPGEPT